MNTSEVKFLKKHWNISFEDWEKELNLEGKKGWKVIQIIQGGDGYFRALLRRDA